MRRLGGRSSQSTRPVLDDAPWQMDGRSLSQHGGFVKAHVMIDVETLDVLAVVVTDDRVSNDRVFASLIEQALKRGVVVRTVLADGAYDKKTSSIRFARLASMLSLRCRGAAKGLTVARELG